MNTFARAAASYHGIPHDVIVRSDVHTGDDGVLYITVQIPIRDEDLGQIVKRMEQLGEQAQEQPAFVAYDLDQLAQWRDDYEALSPAERGKYGSFHRYKTARQAEQFEADGLPGMWDVRTPEEVEKLVRDEHARIGADIGSEGVGGRKVQHVDVAEEPEAVSELPAAVWVHEKDIEGGQLAMASDFRFMEDKTGEYLIQSAMLTPEQKAKYCGEQKS